MDQGRRRTYDKLLALNAKHHGINSINYAPHILLDRAKFDLRNEKGRNADEHIQQALEIIRGDARADAFMRLAGLLDVAVGALVSEEIQ